MTTYPLAQVDGISLPRCFIDGYLIEVQVQFGGLFLHLEELNHLPIPLPDKLDDLLLTVQFLAPPGAYDFKTGKPALEEGHDSAVVKVGVKVSRRVILFRLIPRS
jgi:hypothetical protein